VRRVNYEGPCGNEANKGRRKKYGFGLKDAGKERRKNWELLIKKKKKLS